jgi:hypothetical protein
MTRQCDDPWGRSHRPAARGIRRARASRPPWRGCRSSLGTILKRLRGCHASGVRQPSDDTRAPSLTGLRRAASRAVPTPILLVPRAGRPAWLHRPRRRDRLAVRRRLHGRGLSHARCLLRKHGLPDVRVSDGDALGANPLPEAIRSYVDRVVHNAAALDDGRPAPTCHGGPRGPDPDRTPGAGVRRARKVSRCSDFLCRRRDSNPRHADCDSAQLWLSHRGFGRDWTRRWPHARPRGARHSARSPALARSCPGRRAHRWPRTLAAGRVSGRGLEPLTVCMASGHALHAPRQCATLGAFVGVICDRLGSPAVTRTRSWVR